MPYCQEHGIMILAYTPLDDGRLATAARLRRNASSRVLAQIATEVQRTMAQVALNWCTTRPNVFTIPKSDSVERTVENCQASDWRLTPVQVRQLDEAFR
jgi:diketogulonate reductase-like aldo/keto reductase